jgi:transposase InsO family protein
LQRKFRDRVQLTNGNRLFFLQLYRWFPSILKAMTIVQPDTLLRWHREGVRRYWRWKSRNLGGRPAISGELRPLIRRMSLENPLWGAPHIHGELLKLGFTVAQSTVAKYMAQKDDDPSGQSWGTFLRIMRRTSPPWTCSWSQPSALACCTELIWINVTAHPTAEWIAQQITEAFPWDEAPRYLIRDRDAVYGAAVTRRLRAMGIRDKPISAGSPWQNCFAERLIGTIRRECLDHMVVLGQAHLHRTLIKFADYYNTMRIHRSLDKDAPLYCRV